MITVSFVFPSHDVRQSARRLSPKMEGLTLLVLFSTPCPAFSNRFPTRFLAFKQHQMVFQNVTLSGLFCAIVGLRTGRDAIFGVRLRAIPDENCEKSRDSHSYHSYRFASGISIRGENHAAVASESRSCNCNICNVSRDLHLQCLQHLWHFWQILALRVRRLAQNCHSAVAEIAAICANLSVRH
ncbi:MAG: hypothetical protein JNM70_04980 [Anaerolineae bacterium]|nr:hypothetical protein [Anaerolineae bacterium]